MIRRIASLVGAVLLTPSILSAVVTLDFPEGPLNLPNAPQVGAAGGEALSLRMGPQGAVIFRRGDTEQVLAENAKSAGAISGSVLHVDGSSVHVFWRVKLTTPLADVGNPGDKFVYVRTSTDGGKTFAPPQRISRDGGAFQPLAASNGRGAVYAVWMDERFPGGYHLYLNSTTDGGKTWQPRDMRVDTRPEKDGPVMDPAVLAAGDQAWILWSESNVGGAHNEPFLLLLRRSSDRGRTWSDPIRVAAPMAQPSGLTLLRVKDSLLVYWFSEPGLAGAKSTDQGKTWTAVTGLPKDEPIRWVSGTVEPVSGRVILTYTLDREGHFPAVKAASSPDGVQFDASVYVPTKTAHLTSAVLPDVIQGKDGTILALWQDFRYIRSTVCVRVTKDGGRTWAERDTCIEEPPGKFHAFFPKAVSDGAGGFFTQWVRYLDDRMQKTEVVLTRIDPARLPTPSVPTATRARLEERVAGFWKTRMAADWGGSFTYMDHVFRSRVRREAYMGSQGLVKYHDFKIEKLDVTEQVAKATVRYTYEIPELEVISGRPPVKVPTRSEPVTQDWIFVDGDWYVVFKDIMNQSFFRY
jgi:hypothetical protein